MQLNDRDNPFSMCQLFVMPAANHDCFLLFSQTLQKEITQNQGDVVLLLKAGNDLLEGREGAAGSDEIQVTILSCPSPSFAWKSYLYFRLYSNIKN